MRERGLDLVWSRCGVWGEGEGGSKDEGRSDCAGWEAQRARVVGGVRVTLGHRQGSGDFAALSHGLPRAGGVSNGSVLFCVLLLGCHRLRGLLSRGPWRSPHPPPHFMEEETETQRGERQAQGHTASHWKSWGHIPGAVSPRTG